VKKQAHSLLYHCFVQPLNFTTKVLQIYLEELLPKQVMEKGYYDDSVQVELHPGIDIQPDYQHDYGQAVRIDLIILYVM
jgi:hypothetical protein